MNIDRLFAAAKGLGLCALLGLSATARVDANRE